MHVRYAGVSNALTKGLSCHTKSNTTNLLSKVSDTITYVFEHSSVIYSVEFLYRFWSVSGNTQRIFSMLEKTVKIEKYVMYVKLQSSPNFQNSFQ